MKRTCVCVAGLFCVVALAFIFEGYGCGSSSETDGGGGGNDIGDGGGGAAPTAQQLQDAVAITGSTKKSGDLPAGSSDPSKPQITEVDIPSSIGAGSLFQVTVKFHTGTAALQKLLAKIDGASGYFELAVSAVPDTDGETSFPMMLDKGKLGTSTGALTASGHALTASTSGALSGTSVNLIVQLVDANGDSGASKTTAMQFSGTSGTCEGQGCVDGGLEDAGTNECTGKNPVDPCVMDGGTEPTGICYIGTITPPQTYTLACYNPCDSSQMYQTCGTGNLCYPGWVQTSDGGPDVGFGDSGYGIVYICAPAGTTGVGSACTMFNQCENGSQCFGTSVDSQTCVPTCQLDGGTCPDPVNQKCHDAFKQQVLGLCGPKS